MRIGAYEVVSELGRGGMGVVYRARSPDGRDVAIKVLTRASEESVERFERESRLLGLFSQEDGFVPLLEAGKTAEGHFLVMPFFQGGTLKDKLKRGPLGVEEARALGERLAVSLGRAHGKGVVHRDLKPANVLLNDRGEAFVADLGLAKHFRVDLPGASRSRSMTHEGTSAGTIGYMAPEQLDDSRRAGPAADVFSLGALVYECLSGEKPFGGRSLLEYVRSLEAGQPVSLAKQRKDVPAALASAIERSLARDPGKRPEDGTALAKELRACKGERTAGAGRLAWIAVLVASLFIVGGAASAVVFSREEPASPPPERRPPVVPPKAAPRTRESQARDLVASARAKNDKKDWDGAIADSSKAIELDPGSSSAWAARAYARLGKGDQHAAVGDTDKALELDPGNADAWATRGACRQKLGDLERAIASFSKAIELDPELVRAWSGRGEARRNRGDNVGAIQDATRAIALDPLALLPWTIRANARAGKGDMDGATADWTRAIELRPNYAVAWASRGDARRMKGDQDGAIRDSTRAIELDPGNANAWTVRGDAHRQKGDLDGAIQDETRAIALDPKQSFAWVVRGEARRKKGDLDGAIDDSTRALALDPKNNFARYCRGLARSMKGDQEGAVADLERFLELEPAGEDAERVRALLKAMKGK
ncbi:tetratricopeptide repeat protein [bacterium]|nr:tetratricopeptide repeat protein [bacterium]